MSPRTRRRHGCLIALTIIFSLGVILLVIGIMAPRLAPDWTSRFTREEPFGRDEFPPLNEIRAFGSGSNKTVLVHVRGFIRLDGESGGLFGRHGATVQTLAAIRRATLDPEVMALILDIDSGGGGITASDVLLDAVRRFRYSRPDRRVVAIFGDVAASGAYYVALGADHIISHPTTVTGSLGVMIQTLNLREMSEKLGIAGITIKSGPDKDLLNPLSEMTPAQRAMLQKMIDGLHDRFVRLTSEHRGLPEEQVRELADGRIMLARDALVAGLIDEIGYWPDAVSRTAELLQVDRIAVYRYEAGFTLSSLLRARLARPSAGLLDEAVNLLEGRSPLQYRWAY